VDSPDPAAILLATGTEVAVAVEAAQILSAEGISVRVVSLPSWELFEAQDEQYRSSVLPSGLPTVSVEAGVTLGWSRYATASVGIDRFGASAPGSRVLDEFGINPTHVAQVVREQL
jgi:transketolase